MNILYIGDIMGRPGIETVQQALTSIKQEYNVDVTIAQGENVTNGKGITPDDYLKLHNLGIDFVTGGNWTIHLPEIIPLLEDPSVPLLAPANYPSGTAGQRWKYLATPFGKILIVSLLGKIVGRDADKQVDNPLMVIDEILEENNGVERVATIVNFHGDYSSEKRIIGYYLDGRVTAVIGDHWHVPTADAMVLPKSTAHITDVGMCGNLHSSLGVKLEVVIPRWRDGVINKNELETSGIRQFNAVLITVDSQTKLAKSISSINRTFE